MRKKTQRRTTAQRMRQEANNIGRDFAIGILMLCLLALFMSCSRSTAVGLPDFYTMLTANSEKLKASRAKKAVAIERL